MFTMKLGIDRERSVTETLSAFIVNFVLTGFQHMKHLAYFTIVNYYPVDICSIHKHNMYNAIQLGGSFLNLITLTISDPFCSIGLLTTLASLIQFIHVRNALKYILSANSVLHFELHCFYFVTLRDPKILRGKRLCRRSVCFGRDEVVRFEAQHLLRRQNTLRHMLRQC